MKKKLIYIISIALVAIVAVGIQQYYRGYHSNVVAKDGEAHLIYIYPDTDMDSLVRIIEQDFTIVSRWTWNLHCNILRFSSPKPGCYSIGPNEGDMAVVRRLRAGEQQPVKMTFNHVRTRAQLASRLSKQLMLDSLSIISRLEDKDYMGRYGFNRETAVCLFIPDTYEVFWTISPDKLFERMAREYKAFWTPERQAKAKALGLTQSEVATVASICEEETNKDFEYPIIAGLYLNRLQKGMNLQACPTVKFALQDFGLRRILTKHLKTDSPYNTYKYRGLPPGPIRIPRASTMDAVLNRDKNNYLYMCASADFNGTHHFSSSYAAHARYAREYQRALNKRGIK